MKITHGSFFFFVLALITTITRVVNFSPPPIQPNNKGYLRDAHKGHHPPSNNHWLSEHLKTVIKNGDLDSDVLLLLINIFRNKKITCDDELIELHKYIGRLYEGWLSENPIIAHQISDRYHKILIQLSKNVDNSEAMKSALDKVFRAWEVMQGSTTHIGAAPS